MKITKSQLKQLIKEELGSNIVYLVVFGLWNQRFIGIYSDKGKAKEAIKKDIVVQRKKDSGLSFAKERDYRIIDFVLNEQFKEK